MTRNWLEVKKYNDEILAFTGNIVPDGPDNAHDWDCYRAGALSAKAQAVVEIGKVSSDEIEMAKNLWSEAIPLFEKRGEIAAALGAKLNLVELILDHPLSSDDIGGLTEKILEIETAAREAGLPAREAECWHLRAKQAIQLGRPPEEWLFWLEQSLSVLPDNALEKKARHASQIGEAYFSLGSPHHAEPFEKARGYFDQAFQIEKRRMDSWWMANELWNIGKSHEQLGKAKNSLPDYNQAEQCFNQAIDLLQAVGDQETLAKCLHSRIILLKNVFCYKKEQGNFDGSIIKEIQKAFKELHDLNVGIGRETEGVHNTKAQFYHALDKFPEMLEEINTHVEYCRNEFDRKGFSVLHKLAWARQTRQWLIRNSSLRTDPALETLAQEDRNFYIKSMQQLGRPYN